MQSKEGNERFEGNYYEERQASYTRDMPNMRHKDVQNRKELSPDTIGIKVNIGLDTQLTEVSSLLFFITQSDVLLP